LREAGAVIIGKTNAHFMLADFAQTFNDVYGRTNNPWNLKLTPGGSSGGSAAAVSAAETFLDCGCGFSRGDGHATGPGSPSKHWAWCSSAD
jgi:amidase